MVEAAKTKVCILSPSRVIRKAIQGIADISGIECVFSDSLELDSSANGCEVFVVDSSLLLTDRFGRISQAIAASSPTALILGLTAPGQVVGTLGDKVDWVLSYDNLQQGIIESLKVLGVIKRKSERGVMFDEMLAISRIVKHDACNALAVACGAANRLAKVPGIKDNTFHLQLTQSLEALTEHLDRLVELHEKYRAAGYFVKRAG